MAWDTHTKAERFHVVGFFCEKDSRSSLLGLKSTEYRDVLILVYKDSRTKSAVISFLVPLSALN